MTIANSRTADYPIDAIFLNRWSPRAFSADALSQNDLLTILEAARWAPSSYNSQPWRFVYAKRSTPHWETFLSLLTAFNASWAQNAAALVVVISKTTMLVPGMDEETPAYNHSFDAGAAWGFLALQAAHSGYQAHCMAGFDKVKAAQELNVPANYRVEAMIALGKQGDANTLPAAMKVREIPSERLSLSAMIFDGRCPEL